MNKHGGRLITTTRNNTDSTKLTEQKKPRKQKWEGKQHYELFKRQTNEISHGKKVRHG